MGGGHLSNNAFTLVELLGVLIILAVISLITIPIIDNAIKNSREEAYKRTVENIITAARNYGTSNNLGYETLKQPLYISELQNEGFLSLDIKNPIDESDMTGCVWYYWDEGHKQYIFEYDSECELVETDSTINIVYNESLVNSNGWAKENVAVTLEGNGNIKYCMGTSACEPNEIVENGVNTKFITNEGTTYICAIASNTLGTTNKECINIKLDKTAPNIEGVEDLIVNKDVTVDLTNGVTYNDSLSGLDGTLTITPSSVDTSVIGTKQATYRVADKAGNVREVVRNIIVDAEAPTIVFSLADSNVINTNGWANKDFYVKASITDNSGTGIKSASSCVTNTSGECTPIATFSGTTKDSLISTEGNNRVCVQVTDNNNKTIKVCSDTYKLDKTAPVVGTATFTGTLGSNNWYTSDVTVNKANGSDVLSGHSSTTSSVSSITSNTSGTIITITTTDLAGNSASRNYAIKVDKNAPTLVAKSSNVEITEGESNVVSNYFTVSYGISGGSLSCSPTNTSVLSAGAQTLSCTATGGNGKKVTSTKQITVNMKQTILSIEYLGYDGTFDVDSTKTYMIIYFGDTSSEPKTATVVDSDTEEFGNGTAGKISTASYLNGKIILIQGNMCANRLFVINFNGESKKINSINYIGDYGTFDIDSNKIYFILKTSGSVNTDVESEIFLIENGKPIGWTGNESGHYIDGNQIYITGSSHYRLYSIEF